MDLELVEIFCEYVAKCFGLGLLQESELYLKRFCI